MGEKVATQTTSNASPKLSTREKIFLLLPISGLLLALGLHLFLPTVYPENYDAQTYRWVLVGCLALYIVLAAVSFALPRLQRFLVYYAPWFLPLQLPLSSSTS